MNNQMNTSAKRLLGLINRLDSVQGESVYHHYSKAFDNRDYEAVFGLVVRSKELVSQYIADIKGLDDEDLYSAPVTSLQNLFSPQQMHSSYSGLRNHISADLITKLQFADRALSRKGMEKELPPDFINEITESINELERLILNSDLPPELKSVLNAYVVLFRKALTDYQIIGIQAFKDAYQDSIGMTVVNAEILNKPEAQEARKPLKKLLRSFSKVSGVEFKLWDTLISTEPERVMLKDADLTDAEGLT
jgi:hypothetical protein